MLIDLAQLVDRGIVVPGPVLHVGAHLGEERRTYKDLGFAPIWWVEANEDVVPMLKKNLVHYPDNHVVQAVLSDSSKQVLFHLASNGQSSSYLPLGTHAQNHPDVTYVAERILQSTTVDDLWKQGQIAQASLINMDVQGTELDVLRGAEEYLKGVQAAYLEVNREAVYEGCALFGEVDAWLVERGFVCRRVEWTPQAWGDGIWTR